MCGDATATYLKCRQYVQFLRKGRFHVSLSRLRDITSTSTNTIHGIQMQVEKVSGMLSYIFSYFGYEDGGVCGAIGASIELHSLQEAALVNQRHRVTI